MGFSKMTSLRKRPIKDFVLKDMIDVTKSWMDYHYAINQEYVLSESSIKIPICNYLSQYLGDVELEKKIEEFQKRHYDLFFSVDEKKYFFEFKFVKNGYTCRKSEIKRYFDDIARLKNKADAENVECYLLVCGAKKDFLNEFRGSLERQSFENIDTSSPTFDAELYVDEDEDVSSNSAESYKKMFAFEENAENELNMEDEELKRYKESFESDYHLTKATASAKPDFFKDFFELKTKCISLFCEEKDISALGLWKIEKS